MTTGVAPSPVDPGRVRVLVVHNRYLHRGGEDVVVDAEASLLRSRGHEVEVFERSSESLSQSPVGLAAQLVWNGRVSSELAQTALRFQPDVVHVHNTFPYISPAIFKMLRGRPVVQTLHNFRLLCPQAMLLRDGRVCEDCVGHLPWRGALHGCYRGSRVHSTAVAGMLTTHRALGTWNHVSRFVALNEFGRQKFIDGGLPPSRIVIKPNFVDAPPVDAESASREDLLFVGRLSPEKGVGVLVEAASRLSGRASVNVVGSGPASAQLEGRHGFRMLGAMSSPDVLARMRHARALVMPSLWYETFGLVIVEAFASGLPVIASRLGSMAALVRDGETGLLFNPGDAADLANKLQWALDHPAALATMGINARAEYEARYTPERNYDQLIAIYRDAMSHAQNDPR